jgi:hypothetical protein
VQKREPFGVFTRLVRFIARQVKQYKGYGGERGIRTPDTRKGIHAFEARAFSHSAISPHPLASFSFYQGSPLASDFRATLTELGPVSVRLNVPPPQNQAFCSRIPDKLLAEQSFC